jgi:chromosomal replication initiator protein
VKPSDITREGLARIEARVNQQSFDTWFKHIRIEATDKDEVCITVPDRFFEERFRERYTDLLQEELSKALSAARIRVRFSVKEPAADTEPEEKPGGVPRRRFNLQPRYTFENFVVGSCNQFAHAACQAVAGSPAKAYNPLFLYGGVGLGKTHLLNAVGNAILNRHPALRILYVSAEQFTNEVINSLRYERMPEFRNRYRGVDILLIDDIQFIAGKERTQEEFFHTFNTLYEDHRQIVLSSDQFPKDMPRMEERLRSRLECGLIADLRLPDTETRIAILRRKAETERIPLPDAVAELIANHIKTNIRELEGALIRLGAYSTLTGQAITPELVRFVLRDTLEEKPRPHTAEEIQQLVADYFRIKVADLKSKKRTKSLVFPRQIAMYLCREVADLSFPEIGRQFGGKDHTTVIHACRQTEQHQATDPQAGRMIQELRQQLQRG